MVKEHWTKILTIPHPPGHTPPKASVLFSLTLVGWERTQQPVLHHGGSLPSLCFSFVLQCEAPSIHHLLHRISQNTGWGPEVSAILPYTPRSHAVPAFVDLWGLYSHTPLCPPNNVRGLWQGGVGEEPGQGWLRDGREGVGAYPLQGAKVNATVCYSCCQ